MLCQKWKTPTPIMMSEKTLCKVKNHLVGMCAESVMMAVMTVRNVKLFHFQTVDNTFSVLLA